MSAFRKLVSFLAVICLTCRDVRTFPVVDSALNNGGETQLFVNDAQDDGGSGAFSSTEINGTSGVTTASTFSSSALKSSTESPVTNPGTETTLKDTVTTPTGETSSPAAVTSSFLLTGTSKDYVSTTSPVGGTKTTPGDVSSTSSVDVTRATSSDVSGTSPGNGSSTSISDLSTAGGVTDGEGTTQVNKATTIDENSTQFTGTASDAPATTEGATPPESNGLSSGQVAGIVIGTLAGAALLGVGTYFLVQHIKKRNPYLVF